MNRCFIFKKVRSVDAKKMMETLLKEEEFKDRNSEENLKEVEEIVKEQVLDEPIVKKRRLVLTKPVATMVVTPTNVVAEPVRGPIFTGEKIILKKRKI